MERTKVTEKTLQMPFWFAHGMLTFYAEGAKAYCKAWGPIGQLAIPAVVMWEGVQRQYLETLEAILIPVSDPPTAQGDRISPPIDLLSGFGVLGFEDS